MGKSSPAEAAQMAEAGGYISSGTPGARERAEKVALLAARLISRLGDWNVTKL